jgi:hypothetical protein
MNKFKQEIENYFKVEVIADGQFYFIDPKDPSYRKLEKDDSIMNCWRDGEKMEIRYDPARSEPYYIEIEGLRAYHNGRHNTLREAIAFVVKELLSYEYHIDIVNLSSEYEKLEAKING